MWQPAIREITYTLHFWKPVYICLSGCIHMLDYFCCIQMVGISMNQLPRMSTGEFLSEEKRGLQWAILSNTAEYGDRIKVTLPFSAFVLVFSLPVCPSATPNAYPKSTTVPNFASLLNKWQHLFYSSFIQMAHQFYSFIRFVHSFV